MTFALAIDTVKCNDSKLLNTCACPTLQQKVSLLFLPIENVPTSGVKVVTFHCFLTFYFLATYIERKRTT